MRVVIFTAALLAGCSSCTGGGGARSDGGIDGGTDADSDADTDTGSDSETTPTDTDACDPEDAVSTNGPWEWEDLPEGEDCGPGCTQLTFSQEVRPLHWDVWADLLVYRDETYAANAIDILERNHLRIPDFHPEYHIGPNADGLALSPVAFEGEMYYSVKLSGTQFPTNELIHVDFENQVQTLVSSRQRPDGNNFLAATHMDVYGDHLVSRYGCGDWGQNLCSYALPGPCSAALLIEEGNFASPSSIWENILVWGFGYPESEYEIVTDIFAYDFETQERTNLSDHPSTQFVPRIHGRRVVWADLRYSASGTIDGPWDHAVVFLHDLDTEESTQLTSGDWICTDPDVFGDVVIWSDYRACSNPNNKDDLTNVEIWGYDIGTQEEFQITDLPGRAKAFPRIWGDRVFVQMKKQDPSWEDAIYMFELPDGRK